MPAQDWPQRNLMSAGVVESDGQDVLRGIRGVHAHHHRRIFLPQSGWAPNGDHRTLGAPRHRHAHRAEYSRAQRGQLTRAEDDLRREGRLLNEHVTGATLDRLALDADLGIDLAGAVDDPRDQLLCDVFRLLQVRVRNVAVPRFARPGTAGKDVNCPDGYAEGSGVRDRPTEREV